MNIEAISKFERLFRVGAGLDIDKMDLRRMEQVVDRKTADLLIRGEAFAAANGRKIVEDYDIPITKGLQERIHEFRKIDAELGLKPVLDRLTPRPQLDFAYSDAASAALPEISGAIVLALGRIFRQLDPDVKNPQTQHWERAEAILDQLI
jgi:uncharacterized protein DUF1931